MNKVKQDLVALYHRISDLVVPSPPLPPGNHTLDICLKFYINLYIQAKTAYLCIETQRGCCGDRRHHPLFDHETNNRFLHRLIFFPPFAFLEKNCP